MATIDEEEGQVLQAAATIYATLLTLPSPLGVLMRDEDKALQHRAVAEVLALRAEVKEQVAKAREANLPKSW
jgi:hypothetical protein